MVVTEQKAVFKALVQVISGQKEKDRFLKNEDEINKEMDEKGKTHYEVKYNPFMGVRSDWKDDSLSA